MCVCVMSCAVVMRVWMSNCYLYCHAMVLETAVVGLVGECSAVKAVLL